MAKKIIVALVIAAIAGTYLMAQDAAKPAGPAAPKTGISLTQVVETDNFDTAIGTSVLVNNPIYSQTSVKGQVEFDLGGGFKVIPSITERLDTRLSVSATAPIAFRNRLYFALNNTLAIDKAFNLGLNLEHRIEGTIDQTLTAPAPRTVSAAQFTPTLNLNGKIDVFYYNLSQGLNIAFDKTTAGTLNDNSTDNTLLHLAGTYIVGLQFALSDAVALKLDINDALTLNAINDTTQDYTANTLRAKVILAAGDVNPYAGVVLYNKNTDGTDNNAVFGGSAGVDLKVGSNATFSVAADFGSDSAVTASTQGGTSHAPSLQNVTATLVIKY